MAVYWDCNATTPIEPRVAEAVMRFMVDEFGNAGSRTHEFGIRAKRAVDDARQSIARIVDAAADEVVFTSGATESNNIALLGLAASAESNDKRHIISTALEHKAVLEPLQRLAADGVDITFIPPQRGGWVDPTDVRAALRPTTSLVSVMHANNETGVVQPIEDIAKVLADHPAAFHVDAAQTFGKELPGLRSKRVDLISISGHKLYAPKGVGALVARKRNSRRLPIKPLMFGGGQERGLRPGTLPVALIVGLGVAADIAWAEHDKRRAACERYRGLVLSALEPLDPVFNGDLDKTLPHVLNVSLPGIDSEAVMLALKDIAALSNGSACTSQSYEPSHVLTAMGLPSDQVQQAVRLSWCHMTEEADWGGVTERLQRLA